MTIVDVLSWIFLVTGAVVVVIGGIGLLRLPDFYTRMHAAGIIDTLGAWLIIVGMMLQAGLSLVTAKLVILLVFLVMTSPLSTHALAKAALLRGLEPLEGRELERRGGRD